MEKRPLLTCPQCGSQLTIEEETPQQLTAPTNTEKFSPPYLFDYNAEEAAELHAFYVVKKSSGERNKCRWVDKGAKHYLQRGMSYDFEFSSYDAQNDSLVCEGISFPRDMNCAWSDFRDASGEEIVLYDFPRHDGKDCLCRVIYLYHSGSYILLEEPYSKTKMACFYDSDKDEEEADKLEFIHEGRYLARLCMDLDYPHIFFKCMEGEWQQ